MEFLYGILFLMAVVIGFNLICLVVMFVYVALKAVFHPVRFFKIRSWDDLWFFMYT